MARSWGYRLHEWRELPDEDRDLLLAHDALVCKRCGNLISVCSDPTRDWHPRESTCYPTATREWGLRVLGERRPEKPSTEGLHDNDGVAVWVSEEPIPEGDPDPFA